VVLHVQSGAADHVTGEIEHSVVKLDALPWLTLSTLRDEALPAFKARMRTIDPLCRITATSSPDAKATTYWLAARGNTCAVVTDTIERAHECLYRQCCYSRSDAEKAVPLADVAPTTYTATEASVVAMEAAHAVQSARKKELQAAVDAKAHIATTARIAALRGAVADPILTDTQRASAAVVLALCELALLARVTA
jgi:hypothetical protein